MTDLDKLTALARAVQAAPNPAGIISAKLVLMEALDSEMVLGLIADLNEYKKDYEELGKEFTDSHAAWLEELMRYAAQVRKLEETARIIESKRPKTRRKMERLEAQLVKTKARVRDLEVELAKPILNDIIKSAET